VDLGRGGREVVAIVRPWIERLEVAVRACSDDAGWSDERDGDDESAREGDDE
jgi:hypothetical protein